MIGFLLFLIFIGFIIWLSRQRKRRRAKRYILRTSGAATMRQYLRQHFTVDEDLWIAMQSMTLADLSRLAEDQAWMDAEQWNTVLQDEMTAAMFRDQLQAQHDLDAGLMEQMQSMDIQQLQELAAQEQWMTMEQAHEMAQQFDQMLLDQQVHAMMQDDLIMQQQLDMTDPYQHPGLDIIVDESFHGIDHGDGFTHDFSHDMGSGFPD